MLLDDYFNRSIDEANNILERTIKDCEVEFTLLSDCLALYASAFHAMPAAEDGEAMVARLALISQGLNTLRTSIYAASTGYYIQALIPLRHIYESWLSFWYLAKFPGEAERWLNPEKRPPAAKELLEKIDHPSDESKSQVRAFYGELNRFVHVDPIAVISKLHDDGGKTIIDIGIHFDADDFRACAYGIALWIGMMLDAVSSIISNGDAWHNDHQVITDRIVAMIDRYNAAHGGAPIPPAEADTKAT